jgi:hypothetical protein
MHPSPAALRHRVGGGAFAGLIAGAVLLLILVAVGVLSGVGPWVAMKGAALPLLGDLARSPELDAGAVGLGLMLHALISIGWGALFGLAVDGWSARGTIVLGAIYGVFVWFAMYWIVMPMVGFAETAHATPALPAILSHVAFGLTLGIGYLPFQHETFDRARFSRRALRLAGVPARTPVFSQPARRS